MSDKIYELTIEEFIKKLASKEAVPGGGGASGLVAAIGIALGSMVGELTLGKPKYAEYEDELKRLIDLANDIRDRLIKLIQKDAEVFEPLSKAYGIPKDDSNRDEIMEKCLKDAVSAPLEIFNLACESIEVLEEFGKYGSKIVISDAATGVVCSWAAMYGAAINVKVNTKLMKDRENAETINQYIDERMQEYWPRAEKVYEDIYKTF